MARWVDVPGNEGRYQVSDEGEIRSIQFHGKPRATPLVLRQRKDSDGYSRVNVIAGGRHTTWRVHQIVASGFLGECPVGMVPDHINRDRADNRLANLRYLCAHANGSKFSHAVAERVRCLRSAGQTFQAIAEATGVSQSQVWRICNGVHRVHR